MKMSDYRLVGLSVYYAIQDRLSLDVTGSVLTTTDTKTFTAKHTNWLPHYPAKLYIDGVEVSSGFTINYVQGTITFDVGKSGNITADYRYCFAHIFDDYPDVTREEFKFPSVAIERPSLYESPLQLGRGKAQYYSLYVNVFAINQGQRDDMACEIRDMFDEGITLIDYNMGFPINADGTKNVSFDGSGYTINWLDLERGVVMHPLRILGNGGAERYRMELSIELSTARA